MQSAIVVDMDLRTKMLMKKYVRAKNRESRRQQQSGTAENRADIQLGVVM